jgi:hypothetical protein
MCLISGEIASVEEDLFNPASEPQILLSQLHNYDEVTYGQDAHLFCH